ncbi:hypothetical protein Tco_0570484 [Tanacetum coccineum]
MPQLNQMDYKRTKAYLPRIHRSKAMDEEDRESYHRLEGRLFHEGRLVTPSFIKANNILKVKRDEENNPYIEFKLGQFTFELDTSQLSRIFQTPKVLETFYTSKWSLNSLDDLPNSRFFGPKHDLVRNNITIPRTTQTQLQRDPNKLHTDDLHPELRGWELFLKENFFCTIAIVPPHRFTLHERVINPLDISRNPIKEKGKRVASPSTSSSSSSSSDGNEVPSLLEFYEELSANEDLTDAQREKRGMFKCLNRYFDTITNSSKTSSPNFKRKTLRWVVKTPTYVNLDFSSEEHQNVKTPSPPPTKKSLSPPNAPFKSTSSRSTHYTSSSSPKESIDSGFARFNTIITSLKALDEGFSSKNYVRKFLRALHPKWIAKVTAIEESKDLSSPKPFFNKFLDELIGQSKCTIKLSWNKGFRNSIEAKGKN